MRRHIVLVCVLCCVTDYVWAQRESERRKFIVPPNDVCLMTVASQAESPIQIEKAKLLFFVGPGSNWGASYQLRNSGVKALRIQSITLSMWTAQGVGLSWQEITQDSEKAVLPGQLVPIKEDNHNVEIVPLTDEIREKLKLHGPMKAIVVLMIEQVKFSDGSVYSDERTSKAVQDYFQKIELAERPRE